MSLIFPIAKEGVIVKNSKKITEMKSRNVYEYMLIGEEYVMKAFMSLEVMKKRQEVKKESLRWELHPILLF